MISLYLASVASGRFHRPGWLRSHRLQHELQEALKIEARVDAHQTRGLKSEALIEAPEIHVED